MDVQPQRYRVVLCLYFFNMDGQPQRYRVVLWGFKLVPLGIALPLQAVGFEWGYRLHCIVECCECGGEDLVGDGDCFFGEAGVGGEEFDEVEVGVFFEGGLEDWAGVDVGSGLEFGIVEAFGES